MVNVGRVRVSSWGGRALPAPLPLPLPADAAAAEEEHEALNVALKPSKSTNNLIWGAGMEDD